MTAQTDLFGAPPSKANIAARLQRIRQHRGLAADRLNQGDLTNALKWLEAIRREATLGEPE